MVNMGNARHSDRPAVPTDAGETVASPDGAEEATGELVEALTERAELAERLEEASWFQNQPDVLFLAGLLAVIPSVWAKVRRAIRRRSPRYRDADSAEHTR